MFSPEDLERIAGEAAAELRILLAQREETIKRINELSGLVEAAKADRDRMATAIQQATESIRSLKEDVARLTAELDKRPPAPPPPGPIQVSPNIEVTLDGFGSFRPGLDGERQGEEVRYAGNVSDARIVLDLKNDGQIRTTVERCWSDLPVLTPTLTTRLSIKVGSTMRHDAPLRLHPHGRPTKVLDASRPPVLSAGALQGFIKAGLLPNYDPSAKPSEADLAKIAEGKYPWDRWTCKGLSYDPISEEFGQITNSWSGGAGALLNEAAPLMPAQVAFLLTGDQRAWEAVRQLADSSGNYAIHYKIKADKGGHFPHSDEMASLPFLQGPAQVTLKSASGIVLPVPEPAHEHSLTYLAALLTGDRYYREELEAWASYNVLTRPMNDATAKALRAKGIIWSGQVRAAAWSLRALLHAALAEEWSKTGTYYANSLRENLRWMADTYATPGASKYRVTGVTEFQDYKTVPQTQYVLNPPRYSVATWNHNVLCFELGECVRAGFHEAIPMRDHLLRVAEGIWRHSPSLWDFAHGNHAYPGDDWQAIMDTTFAGRKTPPTGFASHVTQDYAAWARAPFVVGADASLPWAAEALAKVDAVLPGFKSGIPPVWRINPISPTSSNANRRA